MRIFYDFFYVTFMLCTLYHVISFYNCQGERRTLDNHEYGRCSAILQTSNPPWSNYERRRVVESCHDVIQSIVFHCDVSGRILVSSKAPAAYEWYLKAYPTVNLLWQRPQHLYLSIWNYSSIFIYSFKIFCPVYYYKIVRVLRIYDYNFKLFTSLLRARWLFWNENRCPN